MPCLIWFAWSYWALQEFRFWFGAHSPSGIRQTTQGLSKGNISHHGSQMKCQLFVLIEFTLCQRVKLFFITSNLFRKQTNKNPAQLRGFWLHNKEVKYKLSGLFPSGLIAWTQPVTPHPCTAMWAALCCPEPPWLRVPLPFIFLKPHIASLTDLISATSFFLPFSLSNTSSPSSVHCLWLTVVRLGNSGTSIRGLI